MWFCLPLTYSLKVHSVASSASSRVKLCTDFSTDSTICCEIAHSEITESTYTWAKLVVNFPSKHLIVIQQMWILFILLLSKKKNVTAHLKNLTVQVCTNPICSISYHLRINSAWRKKKVRFGWGDCPENYRSLQTKCRQSLGMTDSWKYSIWQVYIENNSLMFF